MRFFFFTIWRVRDMYNLLVADDEEKIRLLIKKYAEYEGHRVTEAKTGMEAVELCRSEEFDLVVLDIMMPELVPSCPDSCAARTSACRCP